MSDQGGQGGEPDNKQDKKPGGQESDDLRRVYRALGATALLGVVGALIYSLAAKASTGERASAFGGAILISGAFALVGAVIGFVFAIPRSRQDGSSVAPAASGQPVGAPRRLSDYAANTNLEQISDWLTKILIGLGLVEFDAIVVRFGRAADVLHPLLGPEAAARAMALVLMSYFLAWGFFLAYLSTRLWLPKALSRAESEERDQKQKAEIQAKKATKEEVQALESRVYSHLYEAQPGGFVRAIQAIEEFTQRNGSNDSANLWMYLASAYGQKHKWERDHDNKVEADRARDKAVKAVEEALRLGPWTRPILASLYKGDVEGEDDLASLKPDTELDQKLGSS
jgi:hypothetical protein